MTEEAPPRIATLKRFLEGRVGDTWVRANLHVHGSGQDPEAIVQAASSAGIGLIAITDHNTFRFFAAVRDAARRLTTGQLRVLPGIEITLAEGAHIIAIFDEGFSDTKQNVFLGSIRLSAESSANDAVRDLACTDVLERVSDSGGITLVPHPYSDDIGFLDKARKVPTKMAWLETGNLGLIQIRPDKVKFIGHDSNGVWQNRYVLASSSPKHVADSDYSLAPLPQGEAQSAGDIEEGAVWLKLGALSVDGLRQVTCEPRTRVAVDDPGQDREQAILGLAVSGGYFDGLCLRLAPELTCVFGENHSGKTAILDFIAFASGRDLTVLRTGRDDERKLLLRRLNAILQSGGRVDLYLLDRGAPVCCTREFQPVLDGQGEVIEIRDAPTVYTYDEASDSLVPASFPEVPAQPEVYSQGQVGAIRRSLRSQVALIDELAGLSAERNREQEVLGLLSANAGELYDLYETRETVAGRLSALREIRESLAELKRNLATTEHDLWQNTAALFRTIGGHIEGIQLRVAERDPERVLSDWEIAVPDHDDAATAEPTLVTGLVGVVNEYNKEVRRLASELSSAIGSVANEAADLSSTWEPRFAAKKMEVATALREQGLDSPEQLIQKVEALANEKTKIEEEDEPLAAELSAQIAGLEARRKQFLHELRDLWQRIRERRVKKLEELNQELAPDMNIRLQRPDATVFQGIIDQAYDRIASRDHRISGRADQLRAVADSVTPRQLEEAVLNDGKFTDADGTQTSLVEKCGVTNNTERVLCHISSSICTLDLLQTFEEEPVPRVSVRREGTNRLADLTTELSPGEQSAAILELALAARATPLVMDQPEDELGYSYVVNKIVPKMLEAKRARQIIIVSHNANIPVLADAALLVKVRNDPVEGQPRCTVERVESFADEVMRSKVLDLEGGERAFQIRQYRYAVPSRPRG